MELGGAVTFPLSPACGERAPCRRHGASEAGVRGRAWVRAILRRPLTRTADAVSTSPRRLAAPAALRGEGGVSSCQLPQDVVQDAAVAEILDLVERIDPAHQRRLLHGAVRGFDLGDEPLARLEVAREAPDGDGLVALQAEARPGGVALEHERRDPHADEVRAVDALEALSDHGPDAQQ